MWQIQAKVPLLEISVKNEKQLQNVLDSENNFHKRLISEIIRTHLQTSGLNVAQDT